MSGRSSPLSSGSSSIHSADYTTASEMNTPPVQTRNQSRRSSPAETPDGPLHQLSQQPSPRRSGSPARTNSVRSTATPEIGNLSLASRHSVDQDPMNLTEQDLAGRLTQALQELQDEENEVFHDALDQPYVSPQASRTASTASTPPHIPTPPNIPPHISRTPSVASTPPNIPPDISRTPSIASTPPRTPTPPHISPDISRTPSIVTVPRTPTPPRIPTPTRVQSPVRTVRSETSSVSEHGPVGSASGGPIEALSHFAHQMVTCFGPTFAREFGAEAAATYLHDKPFVQVAVSAAMTIARVGADHLRSARMNPYIAEAARNGHGLTQDQWDALTDGEKDQKIAATRKQNKDVQAMQHLTGALSLGLTVVGAVVGHKVPLLRDLGSTAMANELRNGIYAFMRDGQNAYMNSVSVRPGGSGQSARTNNANMESSAKVYGGTQAAGSIASGYLGALRNRAAGVTLSGQVARNSAGDLLHGAELGQHVAGVAAIRAGVNTLIETFEAWLQARHQATQTGGIQQTNWGTNNDPTRLADHSVVRVAWNGVGSLMGQVTGLLGLAGEFNGQQHVQQVVNAIGQAMAFGLSYKAVNHTYQAHAGVRGARRAENAARDLERAQGMALTRTASQRPQGAADNG